MPRPEPTEIRINEHGDETHESWILVRANNVSGNARLFDSEITHQHYIKVTVTRCTRKRDLNRDWLYGHSQPLIEFDLSQAQWGAFVSSFGQGSGVPATLSLFAGKAVPRTATHDSRLAKSHQEVKDAASKAMVEMRKTHAAVNEAFEQKLGVKEIRARLRKLDYAMQNLPANLEFAAKSLTEHTEAVVQKARADIEGMVYAAIKNNTELDRVELPILTGGDMEDLSYEEMYQE